MKIAVGCLLLLATLVECRFWGGYNCGQSSTLRAREPYIGTLRGLGRIVGGEETADCSVIPWQVQVNAGNGLCGGSIISRNHILTAAHCFKRVNFLSHDVKVRVGDHKTNVRGREEKIIKVTKLKVHEQYRPDRKEHDIAILTLAETLDYNRCVAPICLDPYFVPNGEYCIAAGWGTTTFEGVYPKVLKMTKLQTYKGSECKKAFGFNRSNYVRDPKTQICAGYKNGARGACQGDSGGPVMCWSNGRYVQAGLSSYSMECGRANWPSIYTNVPAYYDWIMRNMNEQ